MKRNSKFKEAVLITAVSIVVLVVVVLVVNGIFAVLWDLTSIH